jgi:hypothetical protein
VVFSRYDGTEARISFVDGGHETGVSGDGQSCRRSLEDFASAFEPRED